MYWWLSLTSEICYNTVHWIFAMKYWSLSYKVQQLKLNRDPDVFNRQFTVALLIGICLNMLSALFNNLASSSKLALEAQKLTITALVFTTPLYLSFAILLDAFRRFRNTKSSEQVINNLNVIALSFAFLVYAFGITIVLLISLKIATTSS